jgi:hypothetical protein
MQILQKKRLCENGNLQKYRNVLLGTIVSTYPWEYWLDKLIVPSSIANSGLFSIPLGTALSSDGDEFVNCACCWEATASAYE